MRNRSLTLALLALAATLAAMPATASSHREAPGVIRNPAVDATDFYMFRSYEPGRDDFVTLVANYIPLQDPYGGPNYFPLDPDASYRIHIDNSGDGRANLTFDFRADNDLQDIQLPVGDESVSVPLRNIGQITTDPDSLAALNILETYTVRLTNRGGASGLLTEVDSGSTRLGKPMDNVGRKSFPNYDNYANQFIHNVEIPGCGNGRAFVGQRKDSFAVNLGEVFDLVNLNPIGNPNSQRDDLADKNVTSLILEVPTSCLTGGQTDIIGGWTTAHLPRRRMLRNKPTFDRPESISAGFGQVSRLGMPLVNEIVIGLKDKNKFNASQPKDDLQFATYVTNPTLPEIVEILFPVEAPNNFPRLDLLATFVTGITGLNEFGFGEMQRLNVTIAPTSRGQQNNLGVIGGDNAGFPNGRRPGDDVVDIELRVAMGLLCHAFPGVYCSPADAPTGTLAYTDGTRQRAQQFGDSFPYLRSPIPGSPN